MYMCAETTHTERTRDQRCAGMRLLFRKTCPAVDLSVCSHPVLCLSFDLQLVVARASFPVHRRTHTRASECNYTQSVRGCGRAAKNIPAMGIESGVKSSLRAMIVSMSGFNLELRYVRILATTEVVYVLESFCIERNRDGEREKESAR